jgi:uncharacterized membrane protein YfhO
VVSERGANHITVRAQGPGRLVLAEIAAPGWQVRVDGKPARIETEESILRAVSLEAGEHTVRFDYRPVSVLAGMITGALAWVGLLAAVVWERRRRRGKDEPLAAQHG